MSDAHIYQRDIEAFGRFTVSRIQELVLPIDADFRQALRAMAARLDAATEAVLEEARKAAAARATPPASGRARRGKADPVAAGRDVMRRLVQQAGARPSGAALTRDLLRQKTLATVLRRRPAELAATMTHALDVIEQHGRRLPDHEAWAAEVRRSRDAVAPLAKSVRARRLARRTPTPEMQAARAAWLEVYGAAKLLVRCVLRLHGKLSLMPQIFDDLAAEVRAPTDPAAPTPPSSTPQAGGRRDRRGARGGAMSARG
ncbi:hypothetical protein SOCEGT47_022670 [Sorangium cellulosum]|uniref:Uncharacterized protein n=1 Tax=Sorangium cellulosum TaxID=56 RepID=A0A4P2PY68_SORCE|nr:hypothetical protein [Sorangium cellulosum]AUX21779.1 hypothetical protein SOCEGT47_022670 [Sorangium cellulosum]